MEWGGGGGLDVGGWGRGGRSLEGRVAFFIWMFSKAVIGRSCVCCVHRPCFQSAPAPSTQTILTEADKNSTSVRKKKTKKDTAVN